MEFAFLRKDSDGNIIINNNGTVTCVTEDYKKIHIKIKKCLNNKKKD